MNGRLVILFFFSVVALSASAQPAEEHAYVRYTKQEGLSHDFVTGVMQDATGYIWLSTSLGLNRFNGTGFMQFHSTNDSLSLPSEQLMGMTWLDKNRLAIYTTGLHIIDTRTGTRKNLFIPYHDKKYQYKFNIVMSAKGDIQGDIFLLTRSGFYHYDKNYRLVYRFDYYNNEEVPVSHFIFGNIFGGDLYEFDSKRLLIISTGGLFLYDKEKRQFKKMNAADCPAMAEFLNYPSEFYTFFQPKPGSFIILKSNSDSLVYINPAKNKKVISRLPFNQLGSEFHYRSKLVPVNDTLFYITGHYSGFYKMRFNPASGDIKFYPRKYFPSHLCNGLLTDKDNNLWVATNNGLFRHDSDRSQVQLAYIPSVIVDSIPNTRIDDFHLLGGKIYATLRGFTGLLIFDEKTLAYTWKLGFKKKPNAPYILNAITSIDSSTLLLGSGGPLYSFNISNNRITEILPDKWIEGDWINKMYKDKAGKIWVSCEHIYQYNTVTRQLTLLPEELLNRILRASAICEDAQGNIWLAGQGLCRYNPRSGKVDRTIDSLPYIKMPDISIGTITADQQNNIWLGSNNNGLICYNIDKGSFRQFTRSDGLPEDNIAALTIVGNKLWIACYSGIACMDLRTSQIIRFGKEDGFPDLLMARGASFFYDQASGQLYLGFFNAIARFNPDQLLRKSRPPHVFIEELVISDRNSQFLPGSAVTTPWRDNDIRMTIGSINYSNGPTQRFAYRILKDSNTPWVQLGSQTNFNISNLSPGEHRIQVKAFSLYNRWPEQIREMTITVLPPFWKTNWFVLLTVILTMIVGYLLITWRISIVRKKEMEKTRTQKLKADFYKNQFELEQISNYFSSSLSDKKTEEEVLWDVSKNLIGRMNYMDCVIYLWNKDKTKMIQKAAFGPKGDPVAISTNVFDVLPGQGVVGHVIQTRRPVLINDTRTDKRYRVDDAFRLSEVTVPIFHNGELLGVIDSEHEQPNYFTERDIKILTTIATLLGNKLKQIESEQSLHAKQLELVGINEQLAEAQLAALQAQMNPHFVFNALNSIKRMILDGDNEKASRYLSKFALMIRMTLDHSRDVFVTLGENINYLKSYLEMEQLRFDDSFTYNISTDENIDISETLIPSLMMQPLVENAIWHGLMHVEGPKKILISFAQDQAKITCTIEDNGIGIRESEKLKESQRSPHRSVGLENLNNRIKILNEKYDSDCSLRITDLRNNGDGKRGTLVVLRFNIVNL